jgi:hypothetical protein
MILLIIGLIVLFFVIKIAVSSGIQSAASDETELRMQIANQENKKLQIQRQKLSTQQQIRRDLYNKQVEANTKKRTNHH